MRLSPLPNRSRPAAPFPAARAPERLEKWRDAFPALDAWIRAGAAPGAAMRRLGLTFWAAGQPQAAAEALSESVSLTPGDAAVWLDLGFARRACKEGRGALEAFERAAKLAPGISRIQLAVGLAARELGFGRRAEAALEAALALEPLLDDAAYSLGLIAFEDRRYAEAAQHWRPLAARGYRAPGLNLGLGQCQFFLGEFAAAARSLAAHLEAAPNDAEIALRLALVSFLDGAVRAGPEGAREACARIPAAPSLEALARTSAPLLAAYGYAETALAVARAFLSADDSDPIHRHHLAALSGEPLSRASPAYVSAYFDRFADTFDQQLYGVLKYRVPRKLADLLAATGAPSRRTLDLGCGAGAAGTILRPGAERLVGVDLSEKMLAKAGARGEYDELVQADMVDYLGGCREAFDLVFAADTLIYLGDLSALLAAAAQALAPGGVLAVSLETAQAPYELTPSGRFAHAPRALIAAAAGHGLTLRAMRRAFLRLEAHRRVYGALVVLERRA